MRKVGIWLVMVGLVAASCGKKNPDVIKPKDTATIQTPIDTNSQVNISGAGFNADSAYAFINKQMSYGPRVPNSKEHKACGDYLIATMKTYCDIVIVQSANVSSPTLGILKIRNIMCRFDEKNPKRI